MATPMGAYNVSAKGFLICRKKIAEFISRRDGVFADEKHIYMTNGASEGCKLGLRLAIRDENDGVLLPIPQYPLYSATMSLWKGTVLPYHLDEENKWGLKVEDLEKQVHVAQKQGVNTRAIVVINPGNPTGAVLSEQNIEDIILFCHKHGIMILADEVY